MSLFDEAVQFTDMQQLARFLRRSRRALDISQYPLADKAGVSRSTYCHLELGYRKDIGILELRRICGAIDSFKAEEQQS